MVATALEQFGGVDILFNNAGAGIRKKLHEHTDEEWNFVLNVNLNAMLGAPAPCYRISSRKVAVILSLPLLRFGLWLPPSIPAIALPRQRSSI